MSPLALLGALGTVVSTVAILPHLVHALRTRQPSGSSFAWAFGAFSAGIWFVYGFGVGEVLVAAPGFVTVPVGVVLSVWCAKHARSGSTGTVAGTGAAGATHRTQQISVLESPTVEAPTEWDFPALSARSGDTIEMPRIVA